MTYFEIHGAHECTTIMFQSRYPTADFPSLEKVSNCWINQVFMRKLKSNKTKMKNIKDIYNETCDDFKYIFSIFSIIKKNVLSYNSIMKDFSNFIVNHPENMIIDRTTFQKKKTLVTSDTVLIQSPTTSEKVLIHSPIHHNILNINPSFKKKKEKQYYYKK